MRTWAAALALVALAALYAPRAHGFGVCGSWGDTHMIPLDGSRFDIYDPRPFELIAYNLDDKDRRYEVQVIQAYGVWGGNTVDNDFAIRCGRDVITFRDKRNGHPFIIHLNGRQINDFNPGAKLYFPTAPTQDRERYTIVHVHAGRIDVDCNSRGFTNDYAFGFLTRITTSRPFAPQHFDGNTRNAIYSNAEVEVQPRYAGQLERGACGWLRSRQNPAGMSHFITLESSLFGLSPRDHANEAKEGRKLVDPTGLDEARAACSRAVFQATGVELSKVREWFKNDDRSVEKAIEAFIQGCAVDVYFGAGHDASQMADVVCGYVSLARDGVYQEIVRRTAVIRNCERKPYADPNSLVTLLDEKFRLSQFCNRNPPRERDPLPGGIGFSPTCGELEAGAAKVDAARQEAAQKAAELEKQAQAMRAEAAKEQEGKAIERASLEEEAKKIERERIDTAEKEAKAREDIQKRIADQKEGAKVPEPKVSALRPGTKMVQKSKIFMMDATMAAINPLSKLGSASAAIGTPGSESSESSLSAAPAPKL